MNRKTQRMIKIFMVAIVLLMGVSMLQLPDLHAETKAVPKKAIMSWETAQEYLNPPAYTSNKPWEGSYVYWGNDSGTPMKWQILNTNETGFGDNSMLLFSTGTVGATALIFQRVPKWLRT